MAVRIGGLVRAYAQLQERLRAGLVPAEVEPFHREVQSLIHQVETICRRHRMTPDQLPAPSRRVYRFLKELDGSALPVRDAAPPTTTGALRIANLVRIGNHLAERLWIDRETYASAPARRQLHTTLVDQALAVERLCVRAGRTAAALPAPSRAVYCWLKFLASGDNLARHLTALRRADDAIAACAPPSQRPITVQLVPASTLWRTRRRGRDTLLTINEGFLAADEAVWTALIRHELGLGGTQARHTIAHFAASEAFGAVVFDLTSFALSQGTAGGRVHDLNASFDRVNAAYFGGQLARPLLSWSTVPTARTFGHYQPARDALMLSASLDAPTVPDYVIDAVMHHELLHKQLGVTVSNGRHSVHSAAFRRAEQQYARYAEAAAFLSALARSL